MSPKSIGSGSRLAALTLVTLGLSGISQAAAIHDAAAAANFAEVQALIDKDPTVVSSRNAMGGTALHIAVQGDHLRVTKLLLFCQADVNAKDNRGLTPLHLAMGGEVAAVLLASGADVNARDERGGTPLYAAAFRGQYDVAVLLLFNKADANAKSSNGETPLHAAAASGHRGVAELLLAYGANVNAADDGGDTPLHKAAFFGQAGVAQLLLDDKADVNARDKDGNTALFDAEIEGHMSVAKLLRQRGGRVEAKALVTDFLLAPLRGARSTALLSEVYVVFPVAVAWLAITARSRGKSVFLWSAVGSASYIACTLLFRHFIYKPLVATLTSQSVGSAQNSSKMGLVSALALALPAIIGASFCWLLGRSLLPKQSTETHTYADGSFCGSPINTRLKARGVIAWAGWVSAGFSFVLLNITLISYSPSSLHIIGGLLFWSLFFTVPAVALLSTEGKVPAGILLVSSLLLWGMLLHLAATEYFFLGHLLLETTLVFLCWRALNAAGALRRLPSDALDDVPKGVRASAVVFVLGSMLPLVILMMGLDVGLKSIPPSSLDLIQLLSLHGLSDLIPVLSLLPFSIWALATGIGLLRCRKWSHWSIRIFSAILAFCASVTLLFIPFQSADNLDLLGKVRMAIFFGLVGGVGWFWLYYFNTPRVRESVGIARTGA